MLIQKEKTQSLIGGKNWLKANNMIKLLMCFLFFSFNVFANDVFLEENKACNNKVVINKIKEQIEKNSQLNASVSEIRANKLLLKDLNNFAPDKNFNNEDNYLLSDELFMLKINENMSSYKICRNKDMFMLLYEKDLFNYAQVFLGNKKILDVKY